MEEVTDILLNNTDQTKFIVLFSVAIFGTLMLFLNNLYKAITVKTDTPMHWSWRHFWKGFIRIIMTIVALFFAITNWDTLSLIVFNTDTVPELNALSAFMLGLGSERLLKGMFAGGEGSYKYLKKK